MPPGDENFAEIASELNFSVIPGSSDRKRAHTERMLARAEKRSRQAQKIVEKWKARLAELDSQGIAAKQARLWIEDHPEDELS